MRRPLNSNLPGKWLIPFPEPQKFTTGALLEAMRLYPLVSSTGKVAAADTSITLHTIPAKAGEAGVPVSVPISKGTHLRIDVPGMGLNSKSYRARSVLLASRPASGAHSSCLSLAAEYWGEDVMSYRPSRFVDTDDYKWPRDAFVAFSAGMRACIGRQSAIVEGTAVLARIVSQFRFEPPAEVADKWALRAGESEFERRKRVYMVSR
jgi:cytochrome P450